MKRLLPVNDFSYDFRKLQTTTNREDILTKSELNLGQRNDYLAWRNIFLNEILNKSQGAFYTSSRKTQK